MEVVFPVFVLFRMDYRRDIANNSFNINISLFMKHSLVIVAFVCLCCSCVKENATLAEQPAVTRFVLTANLPPIQEETQFESRSDASMTTLTGHMVTSEGIYVGSQNGTLSNDKTTASLTCEVPTIYFGKTVHLYCVGNGSSLSEELTIQPGDNVGTARFESLYTTSSLHPATSFVMGNSLTFVADGTIQKGSSLALRRTMSKLFIVPGENIDAAEQARLKVVSVRIVNGTTAGYLFKEGVVPGRQNLIQDVEINKTVDQLGVNFPLCYLYPVDNIATIPVNGSKPAVDGKFYIEVTTSYDKQENTTKYKSFIVERNKQYKMTFTSPVPGSADFDISISDWEDGGDVGEIS